MSFMIVELIQYLFLQIVRFSAHWYSLKHSKSVVNNTTDEPRLSKPYLSKATVENDGVRRDDLELLMANLGVFSHPMDEKIPEVLSYGYVSNVFEVEEPSLDEVKEAFDVFDENKDGFIDAWELKRVVSVLGLRERVEIEDSRKMIRAFDENADGRIDFNEFLKLMENTLC